MDSPRIAAARELVDQLNTIFEDANLKARATIDALHVESLARNGVVVIGPPSLKFDGPWGAAEPAWELHVIAGPADNYLAAWGVIDFILQALLDAQLNLSKAEPGGYALTHSATLPTYTLTLNPLD